MFYLIGDNAGCFDVNLHSLQIGYRKLDGPEEKADLYLPFDCLYFVANGNGNLKIDGKSFAGLKRGSVFYVLRGAKAYVQSVSEDVFEVYSVLIDSLDRHNFFAHLGFSKANPITDLDGRMGIVEELYQTAQLKTVDGSYKCVGLLYKLLSFLAGQVCVNVESKNDENEYVERALAYIHMQYYEDINVNKIADLLHLNRSYFSTLFKSVVGVSPLNYLIDFRIKQACKLLEMGKSVTDVATLTGFNSAANFSVHFKRIMRITPSEYRNQTRNQGEIK